MSQGISFTYLFGLTITMTMWGLTQLLLPTAGLRISLKQVVLDTSRKVKITLEELLKKDENSSLVLEGYFTDLAIIKIARTAIIVAIIVAWAGIYLVKYHDLLVNLLVDNKVFIALTDTHIIIVLNTFLAFLGFVVYHRRAKVKDLVDSN